MCIAIILLNVVNLENEKVTNIYGVCTALSKIDVFRCLIFYRIEGNVLKIRTRFPGTEVEFSLGDDDSWEITPLQMQWPGGIVHLRTRFDLFLRLKKIIPIDLLHREKAGGVDPAPPSIIFRLSPRMMYSPMF